MPHKDSDLLSISSSERESKEADVGSRPRLSLRLLTPSTLLSLLMLGLTTLPMASCENGGDDIVPVRVAMAFAGFEESVPPPLSERVSNFIGTLPMLFLMTAPYWTAVPAVLAFPIVYLSRRCGTLFWRLLVLALAGCIVPMISIADPPWGVVGVFGIVSICVWLATSPPLRWLVGKIRFRKRADTLSGPTKPINAVRGGFVGFAILCFTSMAWLGAHSELLIGGKLAALTNVIMGVVALVSARQAGVDCDRFPVFAIRDLLIAMAVIAVTFGWLWV